MQLPYGKGHRPSDKAGCRGCEARHPWSTPGRHGFRRSVRAGCEPVRSQLRRKLLPRGLLVVSLCSCSPLDPEGEWIYQPPEQIGDGWETASLADVGIDPIPIADLVTTLKNSPGHLVHSIVIAVNGRLVLEVYFDGFTHPTYGEKPISYGRETSHCLSSVAKSVTATLLGIAIDRGFITGVNDGVFDFFPELGDLNVGRKSEITLEHLVTMSSGLEWDEWTRPIGDPRNDLMKWLAHDGDLVRFVLERSLVADPGVVFRYNGGLTNVLGEAIRRASGLALDRFSEVYLFDPLGISEFSWIHVRPDFVYASGDISLLPRDMAKLGQLYLQGGIWRGEQLLPRSWIDASASAHLAFESQWQGRAGYSYGWWELSEAYGEGAFEASGWGDQAVIVVPEFDMVAVFTGGSYWEDPLMTSHEMMLGYVLPAVR